MPAALERLIRRLDPDPAPTIGPNTPTGHHPTTVIENDEPPPPPAMPGEPECTCRAFDAIGQNPECPEHPWWGRDPAVLHLADLTRELGSSWKAARRIAAQAERRARFGSAT